MVTSLGVFLKGGIKEAYRLNQMTSTNSEVRLLL